MILPPLADSALEFDVVHLNDVAKIYPRLEYILVPHEVEARVAIKNLPEFTTLSLFDRGNAEEQYQVFMQHLTDLQRVYESLIDEESKKTFCGCWLGGITRKMGEYVYSLGTQYLLAGFIPETGSIAITAGAYDGGTATMFTQMGYKVYTFEMDKISFERTKPVAEKNGFVIENMGLGSYKHKMKYNSNGTAGNRLDETGNDLVDVINIDAYVRENAIPRVDFIQLDVEGAELEILKGAVTTIARWKPILAISAYHKVDDFWVLTDFIKSIRPDYEFALRHYGVTRQNEPHNFENNKDYYFYQLGLEPAQRGLWDYVLFAR